MTPRRRGALPPPSTGGLEDVLASRYSRDDDEPEEGTPATPAPNRTEGTPRTRSTPRTDATESRGARGAGTRRSFYMRPATEQALVKLVDDLHFATRAPKADVWDALVGLAERSEEELRRTLGG